MKLPTKNKLTLLASLLMILLWVLVGAALTISYWFPCFLIVTCGIAAYFVFLKYQKTIQPERRRRLAIISVGAVCCALNERMPYAFERPSVEVLEERASFMMTRVDYADVVSVPLMLLEKDPSKIDLNLLYQIFSERLEIFSTQTIALGLTPISKAHPVLKVIDISQNERCITIKILIMDSRASLKYLQRILEEEMPCL